MKEILFIAGLVFTNLCCSQPADHSQKPQPVKNIIMMIPDGTSTSVLSLARWYKSYPNDRILWLNVDPLITGLVKTHCSDAPIGDSAPTGSTFATGITSQAGYVATYPRKTPDDIVPVDASLANAPAMTILEAAKLKGMTTGLAVTCYFTQATPADFAAHTPDRNQNEQIAEQMVHNHIDVVFGGGTDYLLPAHRRYLAQNGWDTLFDYKQFLAFSGTKVWGLFATEDLPYELDRDPSLVPSLAEMTCKAIEILSKNPDGFFLMVEGSKVDWAAHANDAAGIVTDFLAFDLAVKEAVEFARKDGNTAIVICPDHGTSAISMGNAASTTGYSQLTKKQLMAPVMACQYTAEGFAGRLLANPYDETFIRKLFAEEMGVLEITIPELHAIKKCMKQQHTQSYEKANTANLRQVVNNILNARSFIGFSTGGHTGEDVFLACYHPQDHILRGTVMNTDINRYMCDLLGGVNLLDSTCKYFVGHTSLFPEPFYKTSYDNTENVPLLTIINTKSEKKLQVKAFENKAVLISGRKRQMIPLKTVAVYVDKNEEFYVPKEIKALVE